jgi:hypothetical protein
VAKNAIPTKMLPTQLVIFATTSMTYSEDADTIVPTMGMPLVVKNTATIMEMHQNVTNTVKIMEMHQNVENIAIIMEMLWHV